jgi:type II secretory pathway predicted ATPase ExeA
MYAAFFGLQRRPFAATPDAGCWFHGERFQAALDELLICAEQGQGIGVVTAPPGVGKTLLCERLIREIGEPLTSVLLRHATYHSRRAFLQTILSELAQPYDKPTDQELRLALAPVLKGLGHAGRALLLVVDEAHELSEALLEELRILADQASEGRPLVRLVLCGQPSLEDKLTHPQLQALNQRVRAHISLAPLSRAEASDYLDYRITWAGGRTDELFTGEALDLICRAADGSPRCLNQLCDHALLLAYVAETRRVDVALVEQALDDLRHLPLAWNVGAERAMESNAEPMVWDAASSAVEFGAATEEHGDTLEPEALDERVVMDETEGLDDDTETEALTPSETGEPRRRWEDLLPPPWAEAALETPVESAWGEEVVIDRYAALDDGRVPPDVPITPAATPAATLTTTHDFWQMVTERLETATTIDDRLAAVQHVLEYVDDGVPVAPRSAAPSDAAYPEAHAEVFELGTSSGTSTRVVAESRTIEAPASAVMEPEASHVIEIGGPSPATMPDRASGTLTPSTRPLKNLFTLLRRKQQGRL